MQKIQEEKDFMPSNKFDLLINGWQHIAIIAVGLFKLVNSKYIHHQPFVFGTIIGLASQVGYFTSNRMLVYKSWLTYLLIARFLSRANFLFSCYTGFMLAGMFSF